MYIYIYDGCPLGFKRNHLLYLMSSHPFPTPPLNCMYDSSGQPNRERFCHRIGTSDQFCLQ